MYWNAGTVELGRLQKMLKMTPEEICGNACQIECKTVRLYSVAVI